MYLNINAISEMPFLITVGKVKLIMRVSKYVSKKKLEIMVTVNIG